MKIELEKKEMQMLSEAIEIKKAQLKRASNTEKDADIKALRVKSEQEYQNLQMKLHTAELVK